MPRSSRKSFSTPTPAEKRVTRGVVGSNRQSKSPVSKSPPETASSRGRSRSASTKKSVTTSPAIKKAVSPSPKPNRSKVVNSPGTSARRGRSAVSKSRNSYRESEDGDSDENEEPVVQKKGKKTAKSPTKSRQNTPSKGKQNITEVSKSKKASNTKKASPSTSPSKAKKIKSPSKANKSPSPRSANKQVLATKAAISEPEDAIDEQEGNLDESEGNIVEPEVASVSSKMETASPEKANEERKTSESRKRKREEVEENLENKLESEPEPDTKTAKVAEESVVVSLKEEEPTKERCSDAAGDVGLHAVGIDTSSMESKPLETVACEAVDEAKVEEPAGIVSVDENEYEIILKDDVPPADSNEVIEAAEKMVPPLPSETVKTASNGCSGNGCNEAQVPFSREFVANSAVSGELDPARSFSIVSYNILADCHSQKDFAGEKAPWITDEQLSIHARHQQLMKELKYLDSDIVCLQEVEGSHMTDLLKPDMEALGYQGLFIPRNTTGYCEGEATFYRTSRFTLVASKSLVLEDAINEAIETSTLDAGLKESIKKSLETHAVAMILHLKAANAADEIGVANIHVAYDKLLRLDRKCVQVAQTIRKLIDLVGGVEKPHVICGDFNSQPHTAPYQFVSSGHLSSDSVKQLQTESTVEKSDGKTDPVVNVWPDAFHFPAGGDLKSSYLTVLGSEPLTSRFASDAVLRSVDYIWFSSVSLDVLGALKVVDPAVIQPGVPSSIFPSDHMSLKACLAFK